MSWKGDDGASNKIGNVITNPEGDHVEVVDGRAGFTTTTPQQRKYTIIQRPCMYLTKFVKALPVLFISGVVAWSYYAYVVAIVIKAMSENTVEQVICGVIYHVIFIMFVWSYWMIIFTPPGTVPECWFLSTAAVADLAAAQSEEEWKSKLAEYAEQMACSVKQRSVQGAVRYCEKCQCIKPDRSHHCSVCDVCTLKMDHHCPWVNNCVGFANYKFFVLFLCYALTYCTFIACSSAKYFVHFWVDSSTLTEIGSAKYHIIFVFLVSVLFTISVSSLFWYHVWLLSHNRSTLEQFRAPIFDDNASDKNGWSLGKMNNVREVFGENPFLWCFPIQTHFGDGITFPNRRTGERSAAQYHSIGTYSPTRPETPSRTLVNPIISSSGVVTASETIHSNSTSQLPSGKISALSGVVTPSTLSPECATEVVLDYNGHVKTVTVPENELTELVIQ